MRRSMSVWFACLTGSAFLVFLFAACSGGTAGNTEPEPEKPKPAPLFWDDQQDLDWIYRNPFKTTMRTLWVDCAKIVSLGRGSQKPEYELIEAYAKDISSRAEKLSLRWEAFDAPGKAAIEAVGEKDWLSANAESETFGKACDTCHLETWSPIYQHATKEIVAKWLRNEMPTSHDLFLDEGEPPPAVENRIVMQALLVHHDKAGAAIVAKDAAAVISNVKAVMDVATERARRWRYLKETADALALAAANKEQGLLGQRYREMTSHCAQCHVIHAQFVDPKTPRRAIHNPMPWD